jgi:recombining binding protein (suppressor of hairless)
VVDGGGTAATIELTGENFAPGLSVWFGETESPFTDYRYVVFTFSSTIDYFFLKIRSTQTIVAEVPQFSSVMPNMPWVQRPISTPISLVRRDGIVYLTPLVFTYTPQPAPARKNSPSPSAILPAASDNDFCE